jgi:hypothetical protein
MTDKRQFRPTLAAPASYPRSDEVAGDRRAFLAGIAAAIAGAMIEREAIAGSTIIPGKGKKSDKRDKRDKKQDPKGKGAPPQPPSPRPRDHDGYAQLPEAAVDELTAPKKTKKDQQKTKKPEKTERPPRRTQGVPPQPDRDDKL